VSDPIRGGAPAPFRPLSRSLVLDPGLIPGRVLPIESFAQLLARHVGKTRHRVYTPSVTLAVFLSQVLSDDHSCRAVARLMP
jgi:hypothetical protein